MPSFAPSTEFHLEIILPVHVNTEIFVGQIRMGLCGKKTFLFSLFTIQVLHMHLTLVCVQTETSACFMLTALLFLLLPMFSFTLLKKKFSTMDSIRLFITFMFLQEHIL